MSHVYMEECGQSPQLYSLSGQSERERERERENLQPIVFVCVCTKSMDCSWSGLCAPFIICKPRINDVHTSILKYVGNTFDQHAR